ncbi:MAG: AbrB/MazE/SpoVT family DNA-binding domain-containing protein [Candidatus Woesearchaeota archaeon]
MNKKSRLLDIKTVTITDKWQVAIPKKARESGGFSKNRQAVILSYPHRLIIMSEDEFEKMYPALMSEKSLARDWLSPEDEAAWKDL